MYVALLLMFPAFADGPSGDVTASRIIRTPRTAVAAQLRSLRSIASLMPEDCTRDWEHASTSSTVTYRILSFRRRLSVQLHERDPNRVFELDHEGPKGFITRFVLTESTEGTRVDLTTYLNPPGWPFRSYYRDKVHPLWTGCQETTLAHLESSL